MPFRRYLPVLTGFLAALLVLQSTAPATALVEREIALGLKDALRVGTERVISTVGKIDGFNANPDIRIPLPGILKSVQNGLGSVGFSGMLDDLELRLNRAAEAAVPEGRKLFVDALSQMTLDDAVQIYKGPDDAATSYFRTKMSPALAARFRPVVDESLQDVGAVQAYQTFLGEYERMPFMPSVQTDLAGHVVDRALDGLFLMLAREEKAIRENPAARTTDLLKKLFGN